MHCHTTEILHCRTTVFLIPFHISFQVSGQVSLGTDDESRYLTTTDDERRVSYGGEAFIELSKSQIDFTALKYAKLTESSMIKGYLYHKESDGLKERWLAMDGGVLKCFKKQHQSLLFEINLSEGGYSAIEGRIGKMFAIRLSGTRAFSSHLFASPKIEIIASWLMTLSEAGVRLQDEILREVRKYLAHVYQASAPDILFANTLVFNTCISLH